MINNEAIKDIERIQETINSSPSIPIKDEMQKIIQPLQERVEIQERVIILLLDMLRQQESLSYERIQSTIETIEQKQSNNINDVFWAKAAMWLRQYLVLVGDGRTALQ